MIAFYCQSPPLPGMRRWTLRTAAKQINAAPDLLGRKVHHSTIGRVLKRHHLRPHKSAYFLHIRDPLFFEKMHHILEVYAKKSEYIFCFDECPNIQAISRSGPDDNQNRGTRRESVYERNGTTDLFGFLQVSEGTIRTYCRPSHGTAVLKEVFIDHVHNQPEGEQLHYICDNLSPHFNESFCRTVADLCGITDLSPDELSTGVKRRHWLQSESKRIVIHFLPFHGSWLNQVEVWFGLLKRYTLDGSWFDSVPQLNEAIEAFARTWNTELAHPFDFRYNGEGLEGVVVRRFTRILSSKQENLEQLDSKFIADMSQLIIHLKNTRRELIDDRDWVALIDVLLTRKLEIKEIVNADTGPIRGPRVRKAFRQLCEHIAA